MSLRVALSSPLRPGAAGRTLMVGAPLVVEVTWSRHVAARAVVDVTALGPDDAPCGHWSREGVDLADGSADVAVGLLGEPGLESVRFRVDVRAGEVSESTISESYAVVAGDPARLLGVVETDAPSIWNELQRRGDAGSPATPSGLDDVLAHVRGSLSRDLAPVFEREGYASLPGELDEREAPSSAGLLPWQREVLTRISGAYYMHTPRRYVQWLRAGVGIPLTFVCNTLVDMILWARGVDLPSPDAMATGFNCNSGSLDMLAGAARDYRARHPDRDPADEPFVDRFVPPGPTATAAERAAYDQAKRRSFQKVRPGSVFVWDGHIDVMLRVTEVQVNARRSRRQAQPFDTGGVATLPPIPGALGWRGKALSEQGWLTNLNAEYGGHPCLGHAWIPLEERDPPRRFPPAPLYRPEGDAFRYAPADASADVLRSQVVAPSVYLVVSERGAGEAVTARWTSPPMSLGVPLVALFGAVAALPGSDRWEARWFVLAAGGWEPAAAVTDVDAARALDDAHAESDDGRGRVIVEIYNDRSGVARVYRPQAHATLDSGAPRYLPDFFPRWWTHLTAEVRAAAEGAADAGLRAVVERDALRPAP